MSRRVPARAVSILALAVLSAHGQGVIHVPAQAPTIAQGLSIANPGDTVLVAPGVYFENLVVPQNVTLESSAGPDATVIDGGGVGSVLMMFPDTSLRGFTVRGGVGGSDGSGNGQGGGAHIPLYTFGAQTTFEDCAFVGNVGGSSIAAGGGGIGYTFQSDPPSFSVRRCRFFGNSGGASTHFRGGDGAFSFTVGDVSDCLFVGNLGGPGGVSSSGMGMSGGAGATSSNGRNLTVIGNSAGPPGVGPLGPGPPTGALVSDRITSSIVRRNFPANFVPRDASSTIDGSNVEGQAPGAGNIDADPRFVPGTFELRSDSPCIDAGLESPALLAGELDLSGRPRVHGARVDMGAFEFGYPGSREDLVLESLIDGGGFVLDEIKMAAAGSSVDIAFGSPMGTLIGASFVLVGQAFVTGSPPMAPPGFPELQLDPFGPTAPVLVLMGSLPANGVVASTGVPPGLVGTSVMLQVIVPSSSAANGVFATTSGHELRFVANAPPVITGVSPTGGLQAGDPVVLSGTGFTPAGATVDVAGVPAVPTSVTPTEVAFAMPAVSGSDLVVTVTIIDGQTASIVVNPTPVIDFLTLPSLPGAIGGTTTAVGTSFVPGATATIGGAAGTVTVLSARIANIAVPPGPPGPTTLVLTNPAGASSSIPFTYR